MDEELAWECHDAVLTLLLAANMQPPIREGGLRCMHAYDHMNDVPCTECK